MDYEEWFELYFDALGVSKEGYDQLMQDAATPAGFLGAFTDEIEGYPMLSRINDINIDVVFEIDEIDSLRNECLKVNAQTRNAIALRGTEKLLRACDEAQRLNLNIYFLAD